MGSDYQEAAADSAKNENEVIDQELLADEITELNSINERAEQHLSEDGDDATALLGALEQGFAHMRDMEAPQKAIIFTESKRTQDYLFDFLSRHGFQDRLVAFSD